MQKQGELHAGSAICIKDVAIETQALFHGLSTSMDEPFIPALKFNRCRSFRADLLNKLEMIIRAFGGKRKGGVAKAALRLQVSRQTLQRWLAFSAVPHGRQTLEAIEELYETALETLAAKACEKKTRSKSKLPVLIAERANTLLGDAAPEALAALGFGPRIDLNKYPKVLAELRQCRSFALDLRHKLELIMKACGGRGHGGLRKAGLRITNEPDRAGHWFLGRTVPGDRLTWERIDNVYEDAIEKLAEKQRPKRQIRMTNASQIDLRIASR